MCSIAFRTCQASHFKSCLNKVNAKYALTSVSRKYVSPDVYFTVTLLIDNRTCVRLQLSTKSEVNSPTVQTSEWQNVYKGMLTSRIRNLKIVSFMTSGVGLCIQPMLVLKASEVGSSLAATIGVCTIAGFFTFITPVLIHLVTRKYVTSLEYNKKNDEYIATIISFFLKYKQASVLNVLLKIVID